MQTVDDVVEFLIGVGRRADAGEIPEENGVFARAYLRMTLEEITRLADGTFADPAWMAGFAVAFARKYRDALLDPAARPGPWAVAFDTAAQGQRRAIRALLLGINAHMSYDLPLTLVDGVLDDRDLRHGDYHRVNAVLAAAVDPVQRVLLDRYDRWLSWGDTLGGRLDEVLTLRTFVDTRSVAWHDALKILDGRMTRAELDEKVTRKARALVKLAF